MGTCETIITLILVVLCIASIILAIWDYNDKRGYRTIGIICASLYAFFICDKIEEIDIETDSDYQIWKNI